MSSTGTTGVRRKIAATAVARPPENAFAQHIPYAAMVTLITACCLAIEIMAPEHWQPNVIWFLLAPAGGLIAGAIPALIVVRRSRQRRADGRGKRGPDRPSAEGLRRRARRLGVVVRRRWQAERRIPEVRAARRAAVGLARGNAAGRPAGRGAKERTPLRMGSPLPCGSESRSTMSKQRSWRGTPIAVGAWLASHCSATRASQVMSGRRQTSPRSFAPGRR